MESKSTRVLHFPSTAALIATLLAPAALGQDDWPMYQGNPSHDGYLPIALQPSSIRLDWEVAFPGGGALNPVTAAHGKVFVSKKVPTTEDQLYALDKEDGSILWSTSYGSPFSINPPSYADGKVYLQTCNHSSDTWLWAYDADDGTLQFKQGTSAQWESYFAPTIVDGTVYINGGTYGGMYAIDGTTGQQLWFEGLPQYDDWTPAVDDTHAYAYLGEYSPALYVFDRLTGQQVYTIPDYNFDWSGWSMNLAPVLGGMDDAIAIHGGRLISFDLAQQSIRYEVDDGFTGQPAVSKGVIYAVNNGTLSARDQATGASLWLWQPPGGNLTSQVVVTETHAIVRTSSEVHLVSLATHQSEWSWPASGHVSIGESNLYIAQSNGTLTAIAYQVSPAPVHVSADAAHYAEPMSPVTIEGTGFDSAPGLQVFFGGQEASDVIVQSDQLITCTPPALGPGTVDVIVKNDNGTGVLASAFHYIPLVDLGGTPSPGDVVSLTYRMEANSQILAIWGAPPAVSIPALPYDGTVDIALANTHFIIPWWPADNFTLSVQLPDDPTLVGIEALFQALIGPAILLGDAAWTNHVTLVVQ